MTQEETNLFTGNICGGPGICKTCGKRVSNVAFHESRCGKTDDCDCIDCGGTSHRHSTNCEYMEELTREEPKIDDGGPAFPTPVARPFGNGLLAEGGLTRRDWFAGQALVGLLSSDGDKLAELVNDVFGERFNDNETPTPIALLAYQMADAMIAASKKQQTQ
jgi:hypothetical protein